LTIDPKIRELHNYELQRLVQFYDAPGAIPDRNLFSYNPHKMKENHFVFLKKSFTVHLKPDGEICNRLKAGTKVYLCQIKGEWTKISWRNGKKKGWLKL